MARQDDALRSYTEAYPPHHEFEESWPVQGRMIVRIGLADSPPPAHVRSSVLAIVLAEGRRVLFLWPSNRTGNISHFLVGGRSKPGESPGDTVAREAGEETGWRITTAGLIGYRHFHQIGPKADSSDRPYPDFIQPIYAAKASVFREDMMISADRIPSEFLDYEVAVEATDVKHRPLLCAAAAALERPSE